VAIAQFTPPDPAPDPMHGLILFAHGARDPRWADPLERLRERLNRAAPRTPVAVAFLDIMEPDLPTAAERLVAAGCEALSIVPIFLGQGGHVRRDLAALIEVLLARHPGMQIQVAPAVGEDNGVLDALAVCCLAALSQPGAVPAKP
jgi:sirohydrochlorin cobaltochelatase